MGTQESAPTAGPSGYGLAPMVAVGGATALCFLGLLAGGYGVLANASAASAAETSSASQNSPVTTPETGVGGKTVTDAGTGPSTVGPTAPPERESAPQKIQPADWVYYIQWGDTLSQISLDTDVSVDRLAQHNAISDVDLIYADAPLRVPYILIPGDEGESDQAK